MQVFPYPKLAEIETHFHLFTVTNRPDFNLKKKKKRQFSFASKRLKETITYKFAMCSSLVETLACV